MLAPLRRVKYVMNLDLSERATRVCMVCLFEVHKGTSLTKAVVTLCLKYGHRCDGRGRTGALALLPMCGPVAVRGSDRSGAHRLEAVLEAKTWLGYG